MSEVLVTTKTFVARMSEVLVATKTFVAGMSEVLVATRRFVARKCGKRTGSGAGGLFEGEVDGGGAAGGHGVVLGVGELLIWGDGSDFPGADGDGGAEVVGPGCIGGDLPQATVDGDGGTVDGLAGGIDDLA